jgi:hypothetical protein
VIPTFPTTRRFRIDPGRGPCDPTAGRDIYWWTDPPAVLYTSISYPVRDDLSALPVDEVFPSDAAAFDATITRPFNRFTLKLNNTSGWANPAAPLPRIQLAIVNGVDDDQEVVWYGTFGIPNIDWHGALIQVVAPDANFWGIYIRQVAGGGPLQKFQARLRWLLTHSGATPVSPAPPLPTVLNAVTPNPGLLISVGPTWISSP